MPEVRLPFTYVIKGRYWRFRRGALKAPLPGQPNDLAFHTEYSRLKALSEQEAPELDTTTVRWLIGRYKVSAEFDALRPATQIDYDKMMAVVATELGNEPFAFVTDMMVKAVRDRFRATPRKAHKIRQMVSLLYGWAAENRHVPPGTNPTRFKRLKTRTKPIVAWSEEEIAAFMASAPTWLKTPVMLALYTGQRRKDVVAMDWQDYQRTFIRVRQSKTGEPLDIACHPALRRHLETVRTKFGGKIARTAKGRPFTPNSLSQALRRHIDDKKSIPHDRSMHGLRYVAAARLEEAGVTPADAITVMGHRTYQMAVKYMSQRKRSQEAVAKQASHGGELC